jgi:iron(III) transport system permease protein
LAKLATPSLAEETLIVGASVSDGAPRPWRRRPFRGGWFNIASAGIGVVFGAIVVYALVRLAIRLFFKDGALDSGLLGRILAYPGLGQMLLNTVAFVLISMVLALIIGAIFAWLMERTDARIGWLSGIMPMLPLLLLPISGAIGWVFLLAPNAGFINVMLRGMMGWFGVDLASGPLNVYSWPGMILLYTAYAIPYAFLMISTGLKTSDSSLEEASRVSGASLPRTLWRVTIPALRPSLGAAALYMIWFGFSFYSVPVVIGTQLNVQVLSVEIVRLITFSYPADLGVAAGLSVFLIAAIGTTWYFQGRILRANHYASLGGKGVRSTPVKLGKWRLPAHIVLIIYVLLTFVFPLLAQAMVALSGYWTADIDWATLNPTRLWTGVTANLPAQTALLNSVGLALLGATIAILAAAVFSTYLRSTNSWWARALDGIVKLPSAVSAIVIGLAFVLAFSGPPFKLSNTFAILLIAYVVLFLPQATISADAAAAQIDKQLAEASRVSGAGGGRTFGRITLPLMLPGLVAGWGLLFVWITSELNASIMLAGTRVPIVGFQILQTFETGGFAVLASLSLVITVINVIVLTASHFLEKALGVGTLRRGTRRGKSVAPSLSAAPELLQPTKLL